jgi:hypothetical protein
MSARPGETVEQITVPLGDPDTLVTAGRQLESAGLELQLAAAQTARTPTLMSSWAGSGSSAFAELTGVQSNSMQASANAVAFAATNVLIGADQLKDAQTKARRAIVRAERARELINAAKEAIRQAIADQKDARERMTMATIAREAAELRLLSSAVDSLLGDSAAAAAIDAADAAYRAAEIDLHEAERREKRATIKLHHAEDDLKEARADGREAADDAELAGLFLQTTLQRIPGGVLGTPGMPSAGQIAAAGHVPKEQPRNVPISEQEPPENWPGFMKSWFKVGRGEWTVLAGTAGMAKKAYDDPEKIPGAFGDLASSAYHDPLGTGKTLIGYDELANGRWEDWLGQTGIGVLAGGGSGAAVARGSRLPRIIGPPAVKPLGTNTPIWAPAFAGRRLDFSKPDLNARSNSGSRVTAPPNRDALASEFPNGVRYTRAGYPVFTPYAEKVVYVDGLDGNMRHDNKLANQAAGIPGPNPPDGYTWHHAEDGRRMELVPSRLHEAVKHTGGRTAMPDQLNVVTPGGAFTPLEQTFGGLGAGGGATAAGPAAAGGP